MPTRKPPEGKANILLTIKKETLNFLSELAKQRDESRNKTICNLIEEYIEEAKNEGDRHAT